MSMRVVLNTRPREQASELSTLLREAGFEAAEAPAIAIEPAWEQPELERIRDEIVLGEFDWIVLPSQNAGRELIAELRQWQSRVVCGMSTARALGLDHVGAALPRFSAAAALTALRVGRGARILVPRAAEGRDELIDGLRSLDVSVEAPLAYRTVPAGDAAARLRRGGIDVVTLCSPSSVASVAAAVARPTLVVCLGQTTATAAHAMAVPVDAVARNTSMVSLVEAVSEALGAAV